MNNSYLKRPFFLAIALVAPLCLNTSAMLRSTTFLGTKAMQAAPLYAARYCTAPKSPTLTTYAPSLTDLQNRYSAIHTRLQNIASDHAQHEARVLPFRALNSTIGLVSLELFSNLFDVGHNILTPLGGIVALGITFVCQRKKEDGILSREHMALSQLRTLENTTKEAGYTVLAREIDDTLRKCMHEQKTH